MRNRVSLLAIFKLWSFFPPPPKKKTYRTEDVSQWSRACLACASPGPCYLDYSNTKAKLQRGSSSML